MINTVILLLSVCEAAVRNFLIKKGMSFMHELLPILARCHDVCSGTPGPIPVPDTCLEKITSTTAGRCSGFGSELFTVEWFNNCSASSWQIIMPRHNLINRFLSGGVAGGGFMGWEGQSPAWTTDCERIELRCFRCSMSPQMFETPFPYEGDGAQKCHSGHKWGSDSSTKSQRSMPVLRFLLSSAG